MYLGIDFGTSGCRAAVIDTDSRLIAQASEPLPAPLTEHGRIQQSPALWVEALQVLLARLSQRVDLHSVQRCAIDGTSGTVLLCDRNGSPLTPALMYNDSSSQRELDRMRVICTDPEHLCLTASSGLAKAVHLAGEVAHDRFYIVSQADYLSGYLRGDWSRSDYHNALKLGFNPMSLAWPDWIRELLPAHQLPEVTAPGTDLGIVSPSVARQLGLSASLQVCAGTTDANAAFLATESTQVGDAVTSLGSTLVLKLLADRPLQDSASGIYSHRLGDYWLVGGASNAGAAILRHYFSANELLELSQHIDPQQDSGLDYYPLTAPGERFPEYDPAMQPRLQPRPDSDVMFLHGLLEGLARIEKAGYDKLVQLGARMPGRIQSSGGGAVNEQWMALRQRLLGVPVLRARHDQASYGAALLALRGLADYTNSTSA